MTIRQTPFVFLKRVGLITFAFAFLPLILATAFGVERDYSSSGLAAVIPSYALLLLLILAVVQFLIVVIVFASWYYTSYKIDEQEIVLRRAIFGGETAIARVPSVTAIETHFGALGRRLDYGDLFITLSDGATARLKNIPNPVQTADRVQDAVNRAIAAGQRIERVPVAELIAGGENNQIEFKASLLWDYRREAVNKDLYEPVMKNVAAFMNTAGGALLIGVSDDGQALGIECDYVGLPKKNVDGWENAFNLAFNQMIGAEMRHNIDLAFEEVDGVVVCLVFVQPSPSPCYLTFKGKEEFYIRTGNSSQPLTVSKAARYMQSRFAT